MNEYEKMTLWHLFHKLWTRDVGSPGYDKEVWLALEQKINAALNRVKS